MKKQNKPKQKQGAKIKETKSDYYFIECDVCNNISLLYKEANEDNLVFCPKCGNNTSEDKKNQTERNKKQ